MSYRYVLCVERAMSNPGTPAPTPSPAVSFSNHTLHPDAILAGLCYLGGDEGRSCSLHGLQLHYGWKSVLWIRDSLVRIRIRGSVPVDPDPALSVSGFQDANKNNFFSKLICLLLFERTFTSVF
jgi:hypothetical protein